MPRAIRQLAESQGIDKQVDIFYTGFWMPTDFKEVGIFVCVAEFRLGLWESLPTRFWRQDHSTPLLAGTLLTSRKTTPKI